MISFLQAWHQNYFVCFLSLLRVQHGRFIITTRAEGRLQLQNFSLRNFPIPLLHTASLVHNAPQHLVACCQTSASVTPSMWGLQLYKRISSSFYTAAPLLICAARLCQPQGFHNHSHSLREIRTKSTVLFFALIHPELERAVEHTALQNNWTSLAWIVLKRHARSFILRHWLEQQLA